jgi:hypothetical protein
LSRPNPITVGAIAAIAYALCDLIHEVLGHGTATLASPQVRAVSLTTVALSTVGSSRLVAAAGTVANLLASLAAFGLWHRWSGSASVRYFLWLLGTLDLFNATAYLLYSGLLDSGDWAVVTAGLQPRLAWRVGMVAVGAAAYAISVRVSAAAFARMAHDGCVRRSDVQRLSVLPYWVGGLLLVLGAVPNPVSPVLILSSGASSGFGAMAGLLWLPRIIGPSESHADERAPPLPFSRVWTALAVVSAAVFVLVIGRGIRV